MEQPIKPDHLCTRSFQWERREGFSLIELLAVMSIMAILAAATIPQLQSVLQASAITQGGQTVAEAINTARQMSSTRNLSVQVRLVNLAYLTNVSATGFNAVQLWGTPSGATTAIPLGRLMVLPAPVVISQNTTNYSPLLFAAGNGTTIAMGSLPTMSVANGLAPYASFSINPSGMITLSSSYLSSLASPTQQAIMPSLYLSIVPANYGAATAAPSMASPPVSVAGAPKDYLIVQINPDTGSTLIYRP
jgi:prepilin-type N-terminal cleavage/methylation domain-containing protein